MAADRALEQNRTGPVWLKDPRIAGLVVETVQAGEQERLFYELHAWVVMPNHVHLLILPKVAVPVITRWLKGSTARRANQLLEHTGRPFWQDESYDHWVRNRKEFDRIVGYIEENPVSAGLVAAAELWPFSSAGWQAKPPAPPHSHSAIVGSGNVETQERGLKPRAGSSPPSRTPWRAAPLVQSPQMEPAPVQVHYCSECGQPWPHEELARFGDRLICSNCKIAYAQKLREGVASTATFTYAGFWIRFVAALIDGVILFVAGVVVQLGFAPMTRSGRVDLMLMVLGAEYLIGMAIGATYEGLFISRFGATPGKMALDLKVVRPDGGPISLGRAVGRYFAKIVSGIILMIGYIMAGFDAQKRALHDMICDTRVIKVTT